MIFSRRCSWSAGSTAGSGKLVVSADGSLAAMVIGFDGWSSPRWTSGHTLLNGDAVEATSDGDRRSRLKPPTCAREGGVVDDLERDIAALLEQFSPDHRLDRRLTMRFGMFAAPFQWFAGVAAT